MRTEHISINYRLTFEAAFHFGTGLRAGLVHRMVARNADDLLYVPGSTLKGVLRDRCEQLARLFDLRTTPLHVQDWAETNPNVDIVARVFGTRFHPVHLYFEDAQMIDEHKELFETDTPTLEAKFKAWQTERRTQVSMSRLTHTAQPGMLYTSEYGIRDLHFEGRIIGMLTGTPLLDLETGTFPLLLLVAGLLSLDRIGGNKSTGAGKVSCAIGDQQVQVDQQPLPVERLLEELPYLESSNSRFGFRLDMCKHCDYT